MVGEAKRLTGVGMCDYSGRLMGLGSAELSSDFFDPNSCSIDSCSKP